MSKLADVGKAENQPVSVGVMEVAEEEIARLQRDVERLQTWYDNLKAAAAEKDETIRAQSERIGDLVADVWRLEGQIQTQEHVYQGLIDRLEAQRDEAVSYYQHLERKHDTEIEALSTLLEKSKEEIVRLQNRVAELEQYNGEKDERVRELGNCNVDLNRQIDGLEHRLENQARTIRVQAETIARLERQLDSLSLEECIDLAYSKHKAQMPSRPPRSPKEPPIAPETANVPGEPKPVHPAPNVTIAGGE